MPRRCTYRSLYQAPIGPRTALMAEVPGHPRITVTPSRASCCSRGNMINFPHPLSTYCIHAARVGNAVQSRMWGEKYTVFYV